MKKLYFIILLLPFFSKAQSPVTHSAGVGDEIPDFSCLACIGTDWFNTENITKADDSVSTAGLNENGNCFQSTCFFTRFLYARNFNFDIPEDATIDSIFVDIRRAASKPNAILDSIVQLEKGDSMVGLNLHSSLYWPTKLQYENYGHDEPLWGTTWLPSDLNDTATGVLLKVVNKSFSIEEAHVDHIRMTIYFSTSTGTYSVTSSPSEIEWINSSNEISVKFYSATSLNCSANIYTMNGRLVKSIHYGESLRGENNFQINTENLVEGIYFLVMNIGSNSFTRKFVIGR